MPLAARFSRHPTRILRQVTMLRLKRAHRAVLADKLPDAANVVLAGFVVGQAVSERPFSLTLASIGIILWAGLMIAAAVASDQEDGA
jgi:hypothetical protein